MVEKENRIKSYNERNIHLFNRTILEDEFNDYFQNEDIYFGEVSGIKQLGRLLNIEQIFGTKSSEIIFLNVGSGRQSLERLLPENALMYYLEPCPQRSTEHTVEGWSENMNMTNEGADVILCWGVLCFVRSLPETMIEFNRVLKKGGLLIADVVTYSTMALPQTVNPDNFVRWVKLFGFDLEEKIEFGYETYHRRVGYRFSKFENFNYRRLMMPQCEGKINNFLPERDWFMR